MRTKYKKSMTSIITIVVFVLIYRSVATARQGIFDVGYWDKYLYSILCCVVLFAFQLIKGKSIIKLPKIVSRFTRLFLAPILIAFVFSIPVIFINYGIMFNNGYLSRAFSNVAFTFLALMQAYLVYTTYDKKGVDLIFYAYTASYVTSIIVAFMSGGLTQFVLMITDSSYNGSVLEMSELSPAFCLFVFYYLYQYRYCKMPKKEALIKVVVSIIILFVGMKRILMIALLLTFVLYKTFKKRTISINIWSRWLSILLIIGAYIFVYLIDSGLFFDWIDYFGVNTMARNELWKTVSSEFSFSLLFLGKGLGYTTKWMDSNWMNTGIIGLTQTTGLHSDILKFYIDFGFVGMGLYLYYFLIYLTKKISKLMDKKAAFIYFLLIIMQFICWFTDNTSFFHICMWPFYMITFSLITDSRYLHE